MDTVAVFGATGFAGAALVEHLLAGARFQVKPIIHSTGNAWRFSRRNLELLSVDVRDRPAVRDALRGVSHVVNCVLGQRDVMTRGLDNLLAASHAAGVRRYVHLSSVSAYGRQPLGAKLHESATPSAVLTNYGEMKLEQDKRVEAAHNGGLPCVLIAPPNISGAYSPFLLRVLSALRSGRLVLVDGGQLPASLVDVHNLAIAIEAALVCDRAEGRRYFVTDECDIDWKQLTDALAVLDGRPRPLPSISNEEASAIAEPAEPSPSISGTLRTLARALGSSDAREMLKSDPMVRQVYSFATERLPGGIGEQVRARLQRGAAPATTAAFRGPEWDPFTTGVQMRAVRHRGEGARDVLGYRPVRDFAASMKAFIRWYEITHGFGGPSWDLLERLYDT